MPDIEIVYGTSERQKLYRISVAAGTTAREAVLASSLTQDFPEADVYAPLGIFGKAVKDDTVLRDKDRIEVYRPLLADPKEARRRRVAARKTDETKTKQ